MTRAAIFTAVLASALVSDCTGASPGGDKAGGPAGPPVVLRMASPYHVDDPPIQDFIQRVAAVSSRDVQINVITDWGNNAPDSEVQVVHAVASGKVDIGWTGSRVFDSSMGPLGFQALSAPMLIDSYAVETAVLDSNMPSRMLSGLNRLGVTGLGLLAGGLRVPVSVDHPLLNPADWRGISFGTLRSEIQERAIRALGASPVEAFSIFRTYDLDHRLIQGFEMSVQRYDIESSFPSRAPYIAGNVILWPQFEVLFANPGRLASLTDQQRAWLRQAADSSVARSVGLVSQTATYVADACALGARVINATPADLSAMRASFRVLYQEMGTDPSTGPYIRQIEALKQSTPPGLTSQIPSSCAGSP